MHILITAGSTMAMLDDVRGLGNIFTGGTGTHLAQEYARAGHHVTLLTSNPGLVHHPFPTLNVRSFITFDDLDRLMGDALCEQRYDLLIHSAAINDYRPAGLFRSGPRGELEPLNSSGKVASGQEELFVRLVPTPKLVAKIRHEWKFMGTLVTFKLQSNVSDQDLVRIAIDKMSDADIVVANCVQWKDRRAILVRRGEIRPYHIHAIPRAQLAAALLTHPEGGPMTKTLTDSQTWWTQVKADPQRFLDWLKAQYHGEVIAHARITQFVERYLPEDSPWRAVILKIAQQELDHANWVGELLTARGLTPAILQKDERYWDKTLPAIDSIQSGAAVAAHAEAMRLERIRAIVEDTQAPQDVREVFARILPQEEFHERAFRTLAGGPTMQAALENHLAGREAIGLIPEAIAA